MGRAGPKGAKAAWAVPAAPLSRVDGRDFVTSIRGGSCRALPVGNYSGGGG